DAEPTADFLALGEELSRARCRPIDGAKHGEHTDGLARVNGALTSVRREDAVSSLLEAWRGARGGAARLVCVQSGERGGRIKL
ncbi:hypothetical protein, partial [Enterobacter asburiae]|uniref:hypothetical protein n=1 Tax=Enterobacter asburiae TaxID=61645 RepID=UPI00402A6C66